MKCSSSISPCLVSLSSLRKLLFLTNHSSRPLLSFFSPQETEISTRRKECEALEAEVKKQNQTCQTLVSAPKIYRWPLSERTDTIDLYLRALLAIITHRQPLRK